MADQQIVSQNFDSGMMQDRARDQLTRGVAWRMTDWILQDQAPLRKRGGWTFGSRDLNALSASNYLASVAWAQFPNNSHLVAVSDTGKLFRMGPTGVIDSASGTLVDAAFIRKSRPFYHVDGLIFPSSDASTDPGRYFDSGGGSFTTGVITGTPPRGRFGFSYGDYAALLNGWDPASSYALRPDRMWFSNVGNYNSWNTGTNGGFMDFGREIIAAAWNRSIFLVWGYETTWLVNGTIPPPGGDFVKQPLFTVGCFDFRSIAAQREYFVWANPSGIFRTDGTSLTDVTKQCGISQLWRSTTLGFNTQTGWICAGGILYGQYYCTITDQNGLNRATFVIDLENYVCTMHTNLQATMYAQRLSGQGTSQEPGQDELFGASRVSARVMRLAPIWTPTAATRYDADGTPVLPVLEGPYWKLGHTEDKRIRFAYVGYDLRDAGDSPRLAVEYVLSPELSTYTSPTNRDGSAKTMPATTQFDRRRIDIRRKAEGVALRIRQTAPSADTRLAEIELEGHPIEGSR